MQINKERMKENSKALLRAIVNETIDIPDNALVFLEPETMLQMITPKRLELMKLIEKKKPKSVNSLAALSGRLKQAVDRDLKILEKYEIIELKKQGRQVTPILKRKIVMFSLENTALKDVSSIKHKSTAYS